jgi:hypothetical protein
MRFFLASAGAGAVAANPLDVTQAGLRGLPLLLAAGVPASKALACCKRAISWSKDIAELSVLVHVLAEVARKANPAEYDAAYKKFSTDATATRIKNKFSNTKKNIDLKIRYMKV